MPKGPYYYNGRARAWAASSFANRFWPVGRGLPTSLLLTEPFKSRQHSLYKLRLECFLYK